MKYKTDDWVLYCPFPDILLMSSERLLSVILCKLPEDPIYDYKIYIDETGKIKKVKESQLFPVTLPTY